MARCAGNSSIQKNKKDTNADSSVSGKKKESSLKKKRTLRTASTIWGVASVKVALTALTRRGGRTEGGVRNTVTKRFPKDAQTSLQLGLQQKGYCQREGKETHVGPNKGGVRRRTFRCWKVGGNLKGPIAQKLQAFTSPVLGQGWERDSLVPLIGKRKMGKEHP